MDADGRNPVRLPIPDTDCVEDWSPDGQWFVTSSARQPNTSQLYLMKTDGTQERKLTEGGADSRARFSPDGKKVVYFRQTRAEGRSVWTVDVDGGNATRLVTEAGLTVPDGAFWSPDGKQIAVVLFDHQVDENGRKRYPDLGTGNFGIEVMDADGTKRRRVPLKGEKIPFISSFGDWR
jgi:Tol biopolymer transport system component